MAGRHQFTAEDLRKRRGDRRRLALEALLDAVRQHRKDKTVGDTLRATDLAEAWRVHPTSAYRVLERLRKSGAVERAGFGVRAEYWITQKGVGKLRWLIKNGRKGGGR